MPQIIQNLMITAYNLKAYKYRYGGDYKKLREQFFKNRDLSLLDLKTIQRERYSEFLKKAVEQSDFYREAYKNIPNYFDIDNIHKLPILRKEDLRKDIDKVVIRTNEVLKTSKTGGTTGKSLEVKKRTKDIQERFAMLDDFRSRFGYKLGKRTAWFSGKSLLTQSDIKNSIFWKTDLLYNVRYYSTFHIKDTYLSYYIDNLKKFKPQFFVGFPSTIYEIAKYGLNNNIDFPADTIKAIFPTAETVTMQMRSVIEAFFKTKMYDQYASSEGAPFIFECTNGNLHVEIQSGVFEVMDENNIKSQSGRLVVTSFTTEGTPLIRYDIGDSITLCDEDKNCGCGNNNPMVKEILGRIDDFVYSPQNGKINLGNVSNTLKDTKGILRFQVIQNELNALHILLIVDKVSFNYEIQEKFIQNWKDRVGEEMKIILEFVDNIQTEKSGKFRIVKNNIKHLI